MEYNKFDNYLRERYRKSKELPMINTLTLNPAIDNIIYLNRFVRNTTNRIQNKTVTMGGKGTHVSMNLRVMGSPSRAFGFGFGLNGRRIIEMLEAEGVSPRFVYSEEGESRDNYLLVEQDTKDSTLISDRGPQPTQAQTAQLCRLLEEEIETGDLFALSGDASNFPDPFIYNRLIDRLSAKRLKIFLDASGESMKRCVEQGPYLVKPNREELAELTGRTLITDADILSAIASLDRYHIEIVAVTMGGGGSIVRAGDALYRIQPPEVNVFNTVGCGDCFMAGMLHATKRGMALEDALRFATACSAATAESPLSVGFDLNRATQLLPAVSIRKI